MNPKKTKSLAIEVATPADDSAYNSNFNFNVERKNIGSNTIPSIKSSEIHSALGVKTEHRHWIERRISEYGFIENQDFIVCRSNLTSKQGRGGHNLKEVWCSIEMAQMLAMVEKTNEGRIARKYFIAIERAYKAKLLEKPQYPIANSLLRRPADHNITFDDNFFKLYMRVYHCVEDWSRETHGNTYSCCGDFINKFVYEALEPKLPEHLKNARYASGDKYAMLHQYFDNDGKKVLQDHLMTMKVLFASVGLGCKEQFEHVFNTVMNTTQVKIEFHEAKQVKTKALRKHN